jgi:hypothetical protein
MKNKVIALLSVLSFSHISSAAFLKLSGTVPDRGMSVKDNRIELQSKSDLKVFVSAMDSKVWVPVASSAPIQQSGTIKVVAP